MSNYKTNKNITMIDDLPFLDDLENNTRNNNGLMMIPSDTSSRVQKTLDLWRFALYLTGGDLKLQKCYWTLFNYEWTNDRCYLKEKIDVSITLNTTNSLHLITHSSNRTLHHGRCNLNTITLQ